MDTLLSIQSITLVGSPIGTGSQASDQILEMVVESCFLVWTRAPASVDPSWSRLREQYSRLTKWPQVIKQWIVWLFGS